MTDDGMDEIGRPNKEFHFHVGRFLHPWKQMQDCKQVLQKGCLYGGHLKKFEECG